MPPPTDLKKATDALHRLVQEEKSYFEELKTQAARLAKTKASEDEDGNKEFQIKQEVRFSLPYLLFLLPIPISASPAELDRTLTTIRSAPWKRLAA